LQCSRKRFGNEAGNNAFGQGIFLHNPFNPYLMKTFGDAFGLNPSGDEKKPSSTDRVKKHRAKNKRTEISWDMHSHDYVKKMAEKE